MITLFIDSSKKELSIALSNSDGIIYTSKVNSYLKHSNYLMNEIILALNKTNLVINDIDNIIVLNGPGSFTGVRVGITISKTLAWALNKKVYVLSTLKALALQEKYAKNIISVISDKYNSGYVGIYVNNKNYEKYIRIDEVDNKIINTKLTIVCYEEDQFVKSLYDLLKNKNEVSIKHIDNYDYLNVINYSLSLAPLNPHIVKPIYLKKIDAEKKL